MKKIDWEIFFGDSSSEEALCLFATHQSSFNEFIANCHYSKERKDSIRILRNRGYKKAICGAQKALRARGFVSYQSDFKNYWSY
jgi:hypothetical protein